MQHRVQLILASLLLVCGTITVRADKAGETLLKDSIASMKKLKSVQYEFTLYQRNSAKKEVVISKGDFAATGKTMFHEQSENFAEDPEYAGKTILHYDGKTVVHYDFKENTYTSSPLGQTPPILIERMYHVYPNYLLEMRRICDSATIGKPTKIDGVPCQVLEMRQSTLSGNTMLYQFFLDANKILRGYRIEGFFDNRRYVTKNMKINAEIPAEIRQWKVPNNAKKQ